jgi:NIPSNAP
MERRQFLASSLAASALAVGAPETLMGAQDSMGAKPREYYQLRCYRLKRSPQTKLTDAYLRDALVPALNRLGIKPVGVFNLAIGPETPSMYVLMPSLSAETLLGLESRLLQDEEYTKAGAPFLNAPAIAPGMVRIESWFMQAFEKVPRLTVPAAAATTPSRVYELRTYESPSIQDHVRKIEMMSNGEGDIFAKCGFWQIFFSDTLIGARLPNLIYMIGFENLGERDKKWAAFLGSPEWKALSSNPHYAYEDIVSNITNLILAPTTYSQI